MEVVEFGFMIKTEREGRSFAISAIWIAMCKFVEEILVNTGFFLCLCMRVKITGLQKANVVWWKGW